jgi:hypothetical protein
MALFKHQLFVSHPFVAGRPFSHSFITAAISLLVSTDAVPALKEFLKEVYDGNFTITYCRSSTLAPGDNEFTTTVINEAGVRAFSTETLPLFNTARLDVNASTGRPSRWHIRGLHEGDVAENEVGAGVRADFQDAYEALTTALTALEVSLFQPDGNELSLTGTVAVPVTLRKLHRRRKKVII